MIVIMTIMSFIQIKKHKCNDTDNIVMCTERKVQQKKKKKISVLVVYNDLSKLCCD